MRQNVSRETTGIKQVIAMLNIYFQQNSAKLYRFTY